MGFPRGWLWKVIAEATAAPSSVSSTLPQHANDEAFLLPTTATTATTATATATTATATTATATATATTATATATTNARTHPAAHARRLSVVLIHQQGLWHGLLRLPPGRKLIAGRHEQRGLLRLLTVVGDIVARVADALGPASVCGADDAFAFAVILLHGDGRAIRELPTIWQVRGHSAGQRVAHIKWRTKTLLRLEPELLGRRGLSGNPLVGLSLHHALVASEASSLVEAATALLTGDLGELRRQLKGDDDVEEAVFAATANVGPLNFQDSVPPSAAGESHDDDDPRGNTSGRDDEDPNDEPEDEFSAHPQDTLAEIALLVQARDQRTRSTLVAAIGSLSGVRAPMDHDVVAAAVSWQVRRLGYDRRERQTLIALGRAPPAVETLGRLAPRHRRSLVFVHTLLAAHMDGRLSPEERFVVATLGRAFDLPPALQSRLRKRALAHLAQNPEAFSPVVLADGFADADPPFSERLGRAVVENADALRTEIRETGDLGVLLARRAGGKQLTSAENKRMRAQLIDVVRAVPSLAVFALPGGFVLVPLLLRLLPFDLRPSAFRGEDFRALEDGSDDDDPSARARHADRALAPPRFWRRRS